MTVVVSPIGDDDVEDVSAFLTVNLNARVSPEVWAEAVRPTWPGAGSQHGMMARDGGRIVGVYLAIYADRVVDGVTRRFCNLAAWCVLPDYRLHSIRMIKSLLAQKDCHFTDFSPSGNVIALNQRLGFESLDTSAVMVPNLPWPALPGRIRVTSDPDRMAVLLSGRDLELYRHHASATAARHLVLSRQDRHCYVVFRRDRRKNLPLFASVLHVGDREVFVAGLRHFGRHLLLRHRIPLTLIERRVAGDLPGPSYQVPRPRPKMFRSPDLSAEQIDYFYSELTNVAW